MVNVARLFRICNIGLYICDQAAFIPIADQELCSITELACLQGAVQLPQDLCQLPLSLVEAIAGLRVRVCMETLADLSQATVTVSQSIEQH